MRGGAGIETGNRLRTAAFSIVGELVVDCEAAARPRFSVQAVTDPAHPAGVDSHDSGFLGLASFGLVPRVWLHSVY